MEIFAVLKYSFKKFYENLFKLFILGISWFILTALFLFMIFFAVSTGYYLLLPIPLLLLGPLFLTALHGVNQLLEQREFSLKELASFFKKNFWRGVLACIFSIIIYLILLFDLRFFLLQGQQNTWLLAFAFLFGYLLIYFSIYEAYLWGLLVIQPEKSLKDIFKNAVVLSLDNIVFSLVWFLALFLLSFFLFIIGFGLPTAFIGIIGSMILKGNKEMLAKY
ncbi:hypothetical protein LJ207_03820 [Halanaerobium sp. Z-7514]|uniref:Integral membrane protein n=1 Tax=Halanaerobium polyolivorans TaxID=2886943 RepID=A0AAW4WTM1_9FIRM|nr:hypothetical protein [Halanaerobium polyolivorans]MCC3144448.1 hypothetical protein [Halanaerobium polyolivorans]